jgi:C1A family cysteine protease
MRRKKGESDFGEFETRLSAFKGHPLSEHLPAKERTKLGALAIHDAEQLVAVCSVEAARPYLADQLEITESELEQLVNKAREPLPEHLVAELEVQEEADRGAGALEPTPEIAAEVTSIPITVEEGPVAALPPSVNWAKRMPPVRHQAGRGTCVAFALTALHEHYRRAVNTPQDFSEQYLYHEIKLLDQRPDLCGTWLSFALQALSQRGQCRESVWSYNPNPPCNNNGVMPSDARADAANFKLQAAKLNPKDVQGMRAAVAGGAVVPFSIPMYGSWYRSPETKRTGRINMRIGNEPVITGHAMCVIGYQDDSSTPGGGYFIVRNSWGMVDWGAQCPYGAGNGTIPYQYIASEGWEACNIAVPASGEADPLPQVVGSSETARTITIETGGRYNIIIR